MTLDRGEEMVDVGDLLAADGHNQIPTLNAGRRGGATGVHVAHQQTVAGSQAHGGAEAPGDRRRDQRHPEATALGGLAPGQGVDPAGQGGVSRDGQVEAVARSVGVDADQRPVAVDHRTTGRPPAHEGGVLEGVLDQPAARATERRPHGGDEPDGHPARPVPRWSQGEHRPTQTGGGGLPPNRGEPGGVDRDDGQVTLDVGRPDLARLGPARREGDRHGRAPQVVGTAQHQTVAHHHAGAAAPIPTDPHHAAGHLRPDPGHRLGHLIQNRHITPLVTSDLISVY